MVSAFKSSDQIHELCGALHLHTTFSDGGVDCSELIIKAKEVNLDFIVVTDHLSLKARESGFEGFSDDLFVFVGYEHNDINNLNHYLALGTSKVIRIHDKPQKYIDEIKKDHGIGFLAHPHEKRHYFKDYPAYPWNDWNIHGYDGIELWNQMSDWLENLKSWLNFFRLFYPRRFLAGVENGLLARWDECNRLRFVSGIGGVDAHTMKAKLGPFRLTIFPIKVELQGIRTHLFFPAPLVKNNIDEAKIAFLNALKNGNGFIANFRRGNALGTRIYVSYSNGVLSLPGPQDPAGILPAVLRVELPETATIRIIKNGSVVHTAQGKNVQFAITEKGLYRMEAFKGKYAWIYSNPFPIGAYPLW